MKDLYRNVRKILDTTVEVALSREDIIIMTGALVSGILISLIVFMVMGNGWVQFASRYSLDYQLMMILFGVFTVKILKSRLINDILIILLLFSVYMNYYGTILYLNFENKQRKVFITATSLLMEPCEFNNEYVKSVVKQ